MKGPGEMEGSGEIKGFNGIWRSQWGNGVVKGQGEMDGRMGQGRWKGGGTWKSEGEMEAGWVRRDEGVGDEIQEGSCEWVVVREL